MALMFLTISCSTGPNIVKGINVDRSTSESNGRRDSSETIYRHLVEDVFGLDEGDVVTESIHVYVTVMGESARPILLKAHLPEAKPWYSYKKEERLADIEAFKQELYQLLKKVFDAPNSEASSHLANAICHLSREITHKHPDAQKSIYCYSDGIEQSEIIDFADYQLDIKRFREDFEMISDKLNTSCELPVMDGIEFKLLNSPKSGGGQFIIACSQFWDYHLSRSGAEFRVSSNAL